MKRRLAFAFVGALAAGALVRADAPQVRRPPGAGAAARSQATVGEWRLFSGSLTATGRRDTVPQEDGGVASTVRLSGSLVITSGDGLPRGFLVEALGFEEGGGTGMGRAVWTDDRGDRIFSRTSGVATRSGRRSEATITGGTGRYAGVVGSYAFTWQYVMSGEPGVIQARTTSVSGQLRWNPPR
jgi:hypothetical protein